MFISGLQIQLESKGLVDLANGVPTAEWAIDGGVFISRTPPALVAARMGIGSAEETQSAVFIGIFQSSICGMHCAFAET